MRIVPETATEEMATRAADKMLYPSVYMGGTPALAIKQAAGVLAVGIAAAPSAGRVSLVTAKALAIDMWLMMRDGPISEPRLAEILMTNLGLEMEGDDA